MTMPLFDIEPHAPAPAALLSARGLELVMAGRCAQLDATTDPDGRDIVWLSADWGSAFYGAFNDDDPDDPGAVQKLLQSGQLTLGAPVVARMATGARPAHLVIGPCDPGASR